MDQVRMPPDAALGRRGAPHSPTVDCNRGLLTEETMTAHVAAVVPIATAKPSSVRWKIFLLMLFLISINYIDRASLSVAMPLIAKEFNLDPAMQGLLLSSFFWTYAFMQVPGGMLADRFKPRDRHRGSHARLGLLPGDRRFRTGWVIFLLTRLGLGASEAPIYPAGGKLNAHLDDAERARPRRDTARRRRPARRGVRSDRHRLADRRLRLLAHGLRHCRRGHDDLRALGLVVHPQHIRASIPP